MSLFRESDYYSNANDRRKVILTKQDIPSVEQWTDEYVMEFLDNSNKDLVIASLVSRLVKPGHRPSTAELRQVWFQNDTQYVYQVLMNYFQTPDGKADLCHFASHSDYGIEHPFIKALTAIYKKLAPASAGSKIEQLLIEHAQTNFTGILLPTLLRIR